MAFSTCCHTLFENLIPVSSKIWPSAQEVLDVLIFCKANGVDLKRISLRNALMLGHLMSKHGMTKEQAEAMVDFALATKATTLIGSDSSVTAQVPLDQKECSSCAKKAYGITCGMPEKFICLPCGSLDEHRTEFTKALMDEAKKYLGAAGVKTRTLTEMLKAVDECASVQALIEQLQAGRLSLPEDDRRDLTKMASSLEIVTKDLTDAQLIAAIHGVTVHGSTPEEVSKWSRSAFPTPMLH